MHINLMTLVVDKLGAQRRAAAGQEVATFTERTLDLAAVFKPRHKIEIVMRSRLLP